MKKSINIGRIGRLIKKDLSENLRKIVVIVSTMIITTIAVWLLTVILKGDSATGASERLNFISTLTSVSLFITPFILYGFINHKLHGVNYSMLPATVLEKLISMLIVGSVIVPLVIYCGAMITDTVLALVTPSVYKGYTFATSENIFNTSSSFVKVAGTFTLITSTAIYGNLLFRKNKMLMTILSVIGINMLLMVVLIILIKSGLDLSEWVKNYTVNNGGQVVITMGKSSGFFVDVNRTVNIIFFILIPSALYTASYFRLKRIRF